MLKWTPAFSSEAWSSSATRRICSANTFAILNRRLCGGWSDSSIISSKYVNALSRTERRPEVIMNIDQPSPW